MFIIILFLDFLLLFCCYFIFNYFFICLISSFAFFLRFASPFFVRFAFFLDPPIAAFPASECKVIRGKLSIFLIKANANAVSFLTLRNSKKSFSFSYFMNKRVATLHLYSFIHSQNSNSASCQLKPIFQYTRSVW